MHSEKEPVDVIAFTGRFKVTGKLHVLSGSRLTDSLNSRTRDFVAFTDAKVYEIDSTKVLYEAPYLALRAAALDLVLPTG